MVVGVRSRGENRDVVQVELRVGGEHGQILQLRLGDNDPIEGIAMMGRKRAYVQRVTMVNG
jgi:hypothetical protein